MNREQLEQFAAFLACYGVKAPFYKASEGDEYPGDGNLESWIDYLTESFEQGHFALPLDACPIAEWIDWKERDQTHGNTRQTHGVCSEKQVASKLKNSEDSLVREDKDDAKEQKSKLDGDLISRQDVYDVLEQYDREHVEPVGYDDYYNGFLKVIGIIPSADTDGDLISRQDVVDALHESGLCYNNWLEVRGEINAVPSATSKNLKEPNKNCEVDLICPNCGARMEEKSEI